MSHSHWTDAEDRARRARRLLADHRWAEALDELRAAVAINPFHADWHFHIGRALDELGRYDDAVDAYSEVLNLDAEHVHALNHMGVSLHQLGRYEESLAVFKRLEETDAEFEPSYCNRIRVYADLGNHQAAEEMFYTARLYRDQCPTCYYNIGLSLAARGQFDRAIFCWQKTIDLAGDDVQVRARIAETLARRGFHEQARRHYLEGLKLDPNHLPTLLDYVSLLINMRRLDEAESKLCHAAANGPVHGGVSFARARLELARRRNDLAEVSLRQTLQLDPTFAGANLLLAQLAVEQDDLIRAKAFLRAELMLRPGSPQILLDLSNMLLDLDEIRLAVACLKRLTQAEPENAKAWQNLAVAECMRGRFERGIEASLHALEIDPYNLAVRYNLALAYIESGELDYAWDELVYALRLSPRDPALKRLQFRARMMRWWRRFSG